MKKKEETLVSTTTTIKLNAEDLMELLHASGITFHSNSHYDISFHVPGGGDWSHQDINISNDDPITVVVSEEEKR